MMVLRPPAVQSQWTDKLCNTTLYPGAMGVLALRFVLTLPPISAVYARRA
jgi:hypothetical protein